MFYFTFFYFCYFVKTSRGTINKIRNSLRQISELLHPFGRIKGRFGKNHCALLGHTVERCGTTTAPYYSQYPVRQNITKMLKTAEPYWAQEKKDVGKQLHPIGPYIT
jgi:hypothetical protein